MVYYGTGAAVKLPGFSHELNYNEWPSLPVVVEMDSSSPEVSNVTREYTVESPEESPIHVPGGSTVTSDVPGRGNTRKQQDKMQHVFVKAAELTRKRNLEGNADKPTYVNSFAPLSDMDIIYKAARMGVQIPVDNFESISVLRQMEIARNNMKVRNHDDPVNSMHIHDNRGNVIPLSLTWIDPVEIEDKTFIPIKTRRKRKNYNRNVIISPNLKSGRPFTRSQKASASSALPPSKSGRLRQVPSKYK